MKYIDSIRLRNDFPIFFHEYFGKRLIYLDSASTTQKPQSVIDAMSNFYTTSYANIHRGIYRLSEDATAAYEAVRALTARFINADPKEIIFTTGATESSNMLVRMLSSRLSPDDSIVMSALEHHSALIPWQQVGSDLGVDIRFAELTSSHVIDTNSFVKLLDDSVKIVVLTHVSNVTGSILDVPLLVQEVRVHAPNALVILDASQSAPSILIDVDVLGVDFLFFSAHKMLGPTGVGVLYGSYTILDQLDPISFGGGMINEVKKNSSTWAPVPHRFEAGTPNIAGVIGFGAALQYLNEIGLNSIMLHEHALASYAHKKLSEIPEVIINSNPNSSVIVNFNINGVHPHDVAALLDEEGILVRAGHHCAQLLTNHFGQEATVRVSFYIYNTEADVDALVAGVRKVISTLL